MIRVEAKHYVKKNRLSKIPYIGRSGTLQLIESLYKKGSNNIEILNIRDDSSGTTFITEVAVEVVNYEHVREILTLLLKTFPFNVEEVKTRLFKIRWDSKFSYEQILLYGAPKNSDLK